MIKKGKINIFYPIIFDLIINIFALNLSIPECFWISLEFQQSSYELCFEIYQVLFLKSET